jgi:purine-nucleoside phosphorylase
MTHSAKSTAALIRQQIPVRPALAMILGSGFQHALVHLQTPREIAYGELPGFPRVGVSGHAGKLVFGYFDKVPVVVLKGRAHYYEGHEMERVTFPVRALAELGVGAILLTNAAGGVNKSFRAGDFMALTDHINLMGANPLRGPAQPGLPRFVDLSDVYSPALIALARKAARQSGVKLRQGIYLAVSGPNYETPAEIRAFRWLGADAVGMSTVPEAIVARQCGLSVAAISCITNIGGGNPKGGPLLHQDVLATGEKKKAEMALFLKNFAVLFGARR